jgi:hypothetical protein
VWHGKSKSTQNGHLRRRFISFQFYSFLSYESHSVFLVADKLQSPFFSPFLHQIYGHLYVFSFLPYSRSELDRDASAVTVEDLLPSELAVVATIPLSGVVDPCQRPVQHIVRLVLHLPLDRQCVLLLVLGVEHRPVRRDSHRQLVQADHLGGL